MIRHKLDRIFVGQEGQVESLWFRIGPMFKLMSEPENPNDAFDGDLLLEAAQPKLKKPSFYGVVLLNDDYTPMEFVVEVLERFFGKDRTAATQIMLTIHTKGKAVCGLYPKDIAETKAHAVNRYSRESEHPLLCEIEPANNSDE